MKHPCFPAMLLFVTFLAFMSCFDDGGDDETYAIGDTGPSGVGIVFYVTDDGLHGLEVAPVDQSSGSAWSNITGVLIGTTGTSIGTGFANSNAIIAQSGHTASAAKLCRDYRADEEGDWFLPSKVEIKAIWDKLVNDGSGNNNGVGNFYIDGYWSSSEDTAAGAWFLNFNNGSLGADQKDITGGRVRAIRAF